MKWKFETKLNARLTIQQRASWFSLGGAVIVFSFRVALVLIAGDRRSNPNLQVDITHASHVRSQYSFGLPLRMNGIHRTHFDHARLDNLVPRAFPIEFSRPKFNGKSPGNEVGVWTFYHS